MSKTTTWITLTIVAALAMTAGAWFFVMSPRLSTTAEVRAQTVQEEERTVLLTTQLATLKEQFADLETYRAELAGLRGQIPESDELSAYRRAIDEVAEAAGVTILTYSTGVPVRASTPAAAPVPEATSNDVTSDPDAAAQAQEAASAAAAEAASAPSGRLIGVPISVTVVGGYSEAAAFLAGLQSGVDRLLLVGGLGSVSQADTPGGAGRPATTPGDVELAIDGFVMVLPQMAAPDGAEAPTPAEKAPLQSSDRNPFAPIG